MVTFTVVKRSLAAVNRSSLTSLLLFLRGEINSACRITAKPHNSNSRRFSPEWKTSSHSFTPKFLNLLYKWIDCSYRNCNVPEVTDESVMNRQTDRSETRMHVPFIIPVNGSLGGEGGGLKRFVMEIRSEIFEPEQVR